MDGRWQILYVCVCVCVFVCVPFRNEDIFRTFWLVLTTLKACQRVKTWVSWSGFGSGSTLGSRSGVGGVVGGWGKTFKASYVILKIARVPGRLQTSLRVLIALPPSNTRTRTGEDREKETEFGGSTLYSQRSSSQSCSAVHL